MGQAYQNDSKKRLRSDPRDSVVLFSSELGLGREQLWDIINEAIAT
jgi:GTP-binding protein